jgi:hypothetical protein
VWVRLGSLNFGLHIVPNLREMRPTLWEAEQPTVWVTASAQRVAWRKWLAPP